MVEDKISLIYDTSYKVKQMCIYTHIHTHIHKDF